MYLCSVSLLSNLFRKTPKLKVPVDLSAVGCDMHSHLIPGIDDGAQTLEESIVLIKQFELWGYRKIITTPHIMSDYYRNTPEIILGGLEKVKKAVAEVGIKMELEAAAEYYIDFDFEQKIDKEELLTFGNKHILVELSFMNPPENIYRIFFKLITSGYRPILAHPERYSFWHRDISKYEEIRDKGVLLQLNMNSLSGYYSAEVKRVAEQLIDKNIIDFISSDCHREPHQQVMEATRFEPYLQKLIDSGKLLNHTL